MSRNNKTQELRTQYGSPLNLIRSYYHKAGPDIEIENDTQYQEGSLEISIFSLCGSKSWWK